nr:LuxR C-terminal-related transcriptional regulator [Microvirga makkahensis]
MTGGASNKTIARRLDISEATVKVHIKTILRKLRAKTERKRLSGRLRT